jgi:hypothetical protein
MDVNQNKRRNTRIHSVSIEINNRDTYDRPKRATMEELIVREIASPR